MDSTGTQIHKHERDLGWRWDPRRLATVLLMVLQTMTALTGCLSLEVVRGVMSHLSHRWSPALPPSYPLAAVIHKYQKRNRNPINFIHSRDCQGLKFSGLFKLEINESFLICWQEYKSNISNRAVFNPTSSTVDRTEDGTAFMCFCGSCYHEHQENLANLTALSLTEY